jgi:type II restriction enzyme
MATARQVLGNFGERLIATTITCPRCKTGERTLRTMPPNFKCADIVCDFWGFLAQVKTSTVTGSSLARPPRILGAAWAPQKARMDSGIYFSLFIVTVSRSNPNAYAIYFLPSQFRTPEMFVPRAPLSLTAARAGRERYMIDVGQALGAPIRIG